MAYRPSDTSRRLRDGPSLASFEYLRPPLELLFEFRDRRRLLPFGQRWVGADHLDLALDEGTFSFGVAPYARRDAIELLAHVPRRQPPAGLGVDGGPRRIVRWDGRLRASYHATILLPLLVSVDQLSTTKA